MSSPKEIKKLKAELAAVTAAKLSMDVRVDQALEEVERLKQHMEVQEAKEQELISKLSEMEKQ